MRRLLPLALLLAACAKPAEVPKAAPTGPVSAPSADLTPEAVAKAADVPLYPGADAPDGMSTAPKPEADGTTHVSLVLATSDSVDKAVAWYADRLKLTAMPGMGGKTIIGKSPRGNDLIMTIAPEAGRTLIRIKSIAYGH